MGTKGVKSSTETWNVARAFSESHIGIPLIRCRELVKKSNFGYSTQEEKYTFLNDDEMLIRNRIFSIKELHLELNQIYEDILFLFSKDQRKQLIGIRVKLDIAGKYLPHSFNKNLDQRNNSINYGINEDVFQECLRLLTEVLLEIKSPLNQKNLIFGKSDELDLDDVYDELVQEG